MPFLVPGASIAFNKSLQNRIAWTGVSATTMGGVFYTIANHLINTCGFTCKGSCDGTTGAMDGVNRWTNAAAASTVFGGASGAQSWIVITLAGGRGDVVFSHNNKPNASGPQRGDIISFWWSPGGNAIVNAGGSTWEPTATDQIVLNGFYTNSLDPGCTIMGSVAADKLVSVWAEPSKHGFRVAIASSGAFQSEFGVATVAQDQYGAGITVLDVVAFYMNGGLNFRTTPSTTLNHQASAANQGTTQVLFRGRRTDGAGATLECARKMKVVGQGLTTAIDPQIENTGFGGLQGGAMYSMKTVGLYSTSGSPNNGDVGTLMDWYASKVNAADGNTIGNLDWICVENTCSMWWPWDGATPVVMS